MVLIFSDICKFLSPYLLYNSLILRYVFPIVNKKAPLVRGFPLSTECKGLVIFGVRTVTCTGCGWLLAEYGALALLLFTP